LIRQSRFHKRQILCATPFTKRMDARVKPGHDVGNRALTPPGVSRHAGIHFA
jgi:hypothetical protein